MSKFKFDIKIFGHSFIGLELEFNKFKDNSKEVKPNPIDPISIPNLNDNRTNNPDYKGTIKQDLKEIEQQLNPVKKIEPKIVKCESCEGTTYDDDIYACSKCKKPICSLCGSYDSSSKKHYCDTCWLEV